MWYSAVGLGWQHLDPQVCLDVGEGTKGHGALAVLPDRPKIPEDLYSFSCAYFYYGLSSPFSDSFSAMMCTYGFRLVDITPNAMTCMALFALLCEDFVSPLLYPLH